jgi:hypothetical protein
MSSMMNDRIRAAAGRQPVEEPDTEAPVDFDGGARTSLPSPPPTMNDVLRAAREGLDVEEYRRSAARFEA